MNTPAHLILGAALFARPDKRGTWLGGLLGGLAPDLSRYLLAGVSLMVLQIPPERVFGELYFSDAWQTIFAIDNSVFVWGALLAVAVWRGGSAWIAFTGAALLHIALDFPLHHDDGRAHFWPLTDWVFASPFSYWDMRQGAAIIAPLEALLVAIATVFLAMRYREWWLRAAFIALLLAELWVVYQWFVFVPGG